MSVSRITHLLTEIRLEAYSQVLCLTGKQGSLLGSSLLLTFFDLQIFIHAQAACYKQHLVKGGCPFISASFDETMLKCWLWLRQYNYGLCMYRILFSYVCKLCHCLTMMRSCCKTSFTMNHEVKSCQWTIRNWPPPGPSQHVCLNWYVWRVFLDQQLKLNITQVVCSKHSFGWVVDFESHLHNFIIRGFSWIKKIA